MKRIIFLIAVIAFVNLHTGAMEPASDTAKKEQVAKADAKTIVNPAPAETRFVLVGSISDFDALLSVITDPNPTYRDVKEVEQWVRSQISYQVQKQIQAAKNPPEKPKPKG